MKVSRGLGRGWLYKNGYGCGGAIRMVGRQCRMVWDGQAVVVTVTRRWLVNRGRASFAVEAGQIG